MRATGQQNVMATSAWDDDAGRFPRHPPFKAVILAARSWSKRPERRMTVHTKDAGADLRRSTWMAEAQAGDSVAYQTLLRDCIPVIKTVARRRGVAAALVDDVVQDVLLTIHRARHTFDPNRSFTAWLCVITERRAIDLLRRIRRQDLREVHAPLAFESHVDQAADPHGGSPMPMRPALSSCGRGFACAPTGSGRAYRAGGTFACRRRRVDAAFQDLAQGQPAPRTEDASRQHQALRKGHVDILKFELLARAPD